MIPFSNQNKKKKKYFALTPFMHFTRSQMLAFSLSLMNSLCTISHSKKIYTSERMSEKKILQQNHF